MCSLQEKGNFSTDTEPENKNMLQLPSATAQETH